LGDVEQNKWKEEGNEPVELNLAGLLRVQFLRNKNTRNGAGRVQRV